jgi:hypothetical protein
MSEATKAPEKLEGFGTLKYNPEIEESGQTVYPTAIVPYEDDLVLTAAFDLETANSRLAELQKFVKFYLQEGEDFGIIPGTPKPTLYKSGADKLCDIYALSDSYRVTNRTEDWDKNLFDYEVECQIKSKRTGKLVSSGLGSCNSYEGKYRWRETQRACPECGKQAIIKGKKDYGGGWLCWKKKDGCGHKFVDGDKAIESQEAGKVENDDIPTLKNTILKMAKKRAKIDAVLAATRSSGLFTQDMEDIANGESHEEGSSKAQVEVAAKKIGEHAKRASKPANAKNGHPLPSPDQLIVFILSYPERQDGDILITGTPKALELVNARRVPPIVREGEESHRLINFNLLSKFYDICNLKGVAVKDLTESKDGTQV